MTQENSILSGFKVVDLGLDPLSIANKDTQPQLPGLNDACNNTNNCVDTNNSNGCTNSGICWT